MRLGGSSARSAVRPLLRRLVQPSRSQLRPGPDHDRCHPGRGARRHGGCAPGRHGRDSSTSRPTARDTRATDETGRFVLLQLPPGPYRVTFRLSGFSTLVQDDVASRSARPSTSTRVSTVSTVEETVTVSGDADVETTRARSATTLNQRTVETTPILGRKFEDLLTLTPGVSVVQGPDGDEITFAGQRGIFNNVSLDGGDYNNGFFGEQVGGQRAAIDITLDAVKEFQVIANGAPAEFGRTAGGVVNVVTKSGTNAPHGNLFHYQRLEGLISELSDGTTLDKFHREQFGGTLGGPIRRDRAVLLRSPSRASPATSSGRISSRTLGTPCPATAPTIGANEALINSSPDCQRLALLNFFQSRLGQDEGQPIEHPISTAAFLLKTDTNLSAANRFVGVLQLQPLAQGERDVRRRHLRHVGQRHRRRPGPHQRHQRESIQHGVGRQAQRAAFHLFARDAAAARGRVEPGRRHRHRFRADVPVRQPVLPAAGRGRAALARADEGQLLVGAGRPHHEGGRRVDAHATTTRCSAASSPAAICSTACRAFCATRRRPRPAASGRDGRVFERLVRHGAGGVPGGQHAHGRTAALLPAGRRPHRAGHRRGWRVPHHQRRVLALRAGSVADPLEPDAAIRPAVGRAAHAGDRRSAHHGVRSVPERPGVPVRRDDSRTSGTSCSRGSARPGTCAATAGRCSASARASTRRGRTC